MGGASIYNVQARGCLLGTKAEVRVLEKLRVKKVDGQKSMEFISKSTATSSPSSSLSERRVFIAQTYGEVWMLYNTGTYMMKGGRTTGPWPEILHYVEAKKRWIVLVINDTGSNPPTRDMLNRADYFDCPIDRTLPATPNRRQFEAKVKEMEKLQEIGRTQLTNEEIEAEVQKLVPFWAVSDSIIWNSQHFSLHLAALILSNSSFNTNRSLFINIGKDLFVAAKDAEANFMLAKHVGCMAGMAVTGALTFGISAIGFWAGGVSSIGRLTYVVASLGSQICGLRQESERFRGWASIGN